MNPRKILFDLTPIGRADSELKDYLEDEADTDRLNKYEKSLKRYRDLKLLQNSFKILFYASVITSFATTIGFEQIEFLQRIASYIGTTALLLMYGISRYFASVARESYNVRREILVTETSDST